MSWQQSWLRVLRAVGSRGIRRLPILCLLLIGLIVSTRWSPNYARAVEITPQLKEQVLQIIRENPEVILESVQAYQQKQREKQQQAQRSLLQKVAANPTALIGSSPSKGAKQGKVVLIEFSDFQCPFCAKADATVRQFIEKHGDTVTFVYKHLPLTSIHPQAMPAAKAAWAAGQQGKFWPFHDGLFANQKQLGDALYQELAKSLGLDLAKFNRDRASDAADKAIEADMAMAETLGIDGTPFFIMNGEVLTGAVSLDDLEAALNKVK